MSDLSCTDIQMIYKQNSFFIISKNAIHRDTKLSSTVNIFNMAKLYMPDITNLCPDFTIDTY